MKAVHLDCGQITIREVAEPDRPPDFALIRLVVGGIDTDLDLQRAYYGVQKLDMSLCIVTETDTASTHARLVNQLRMLLLPLLVP